MPTDRQIKERAKALIDAAREEAEDELSDPILKPGQRVGRGITAKKNRWSDGDIREIYPDVTFTPEETVPIGIFGRTWQLVADRECTVPQCVQGEYEKHRKKMRDGAKPLVTPYGVVDCQPGVGGLAPERVREVA